MNNDDGLNVSITLSMDDFEGTTANMFQVFSNGPESRLDCVYVDFTQKNEETNEAPGKVVARINMSTGRLIELRDLLNRHIPVNDGASSNGE